jgi:hypothetical protein
MRRICCVAHKAMATVSPTSGAGDGFGGNGSGGGTGGCGVGLGGDGFSGMELSLENRFYCSGLP